MLINYVLTKKMCAPPIFDPSRKPQTPRATFYTTKTNAFSLAFYAMHRLEKWNAKFPICNISHISRDLVQRQGCYTPKSYGTAEQVKTDRERWTSIDRFPRIMFFEEIISANQRARRNLWGNELWFFFRNGFAQQKAPKASASAQTITIKWTEPKLKNYIFWKIKMSNGTELSLDSIEPDLVKPRFHLNIVIVLTQQPTTCC